jgi:tetratricopeptide (TPR) repeat protein
MEYLEGQTLAQLVQARGGVMPEQEAVAYILQVCDALQVLHSQGYLHRDIKPSNIIVTRDGRAVLIDFGAARAFAAGQTRVRTIAPTSAYAAPEQYWASGRFDARTDIYALGATLYYLVTGTPPLSAHDRVQGLSLPAPHLVEPRVSEEVSRVILWAMGLQMDERPADVQTWAQALQAAVGGSPASVSAGSGAPPPPSAVPTPQPQYTPAQWQPHGGQVAPPNKVRLGIIISAVAIFAILLLAILMIRLQSRHSAPSKETWYPAPNRPNFEARYPAPSRETGYPAPDRSKQQALQLLKEAFETARQIRDSLAYVQALAEIAKANAQAGQMDTARATFTQALQTVQMIEDTDDRVEALAAIAKAQAKAGQFDTALQTAQMIGYSLARVRALAAIAKVQAKARQLQMARATFTQALQTAQLIENPVFRAVALAEIAEAQAQAGQMDTARATFTYALQTAGADRLAWGFIAEAQARAGLLDDALITAGFFEHSFARLLELVEVAKAKAKAGQFDTALQTVQMIEDSSARAEVLAEIAKAQAQAGLFDTALQTAQKIGYAWYRAPALTAIARAQAKAGRAEDALKWVRRLVDPRARTWALIGVAQGILGIEEDE